MFLMPGSSASANFRHGAIICVLVSDNRASKIAVKMARSFASRPDDQLHIITAVVDPNRRFYAREMLETVTENMETGAGTDTTLTVLVKGDDQTVVEVLLEHLLHLQAHLVLVGSENLCVRPSKLGALVATSFALHLVKELRTIPVLVVKGNSCGAFTQALHAGVRPATSLKCLVDVQPSSRGMLDWLMELLGPDKEHTVALAATHAYDDQMGAKHLAVRMLTTFVCQARVNGFLTSRHLFKEAAPKCLPLAVQEQEIDLLMLQAPRSKTLSPAIVDILWEAHTNVLIFPAADMRQGPSVRPETR